MLRRAVVDCASWTLNRGCRGQACYASTASAEGLDVAIVGAGHNGLVAAVLLARQGLRVGVYEEKAIVGGACRTEYPFLKVPGLGQSTGKVSACQEAWPRLRSTYRWC
jgi:predicted NAD/FAD-binding protein